MNNYTALLAMQATVPEDRSLEKHINYTIEFDVLCPIGQCTFIKKNGPDYSHPDNPLKFYCHVHKRSFYAHTSYVISILAEIIVSRIILSLFTTRVSQRYIAEQYHLSPSSISNLLNGFGGYVNNTMARIRHDAKQLETIYSPSMLNEVVWIDETFFKIAKKSWALILVINVKGEIVGWKLSRTRKESDISDAIRMVDTAMPNFQYIIGDGCIAYPKAMIARKKDVHLIQQMHTHPWRAVRISKFEFLPDTSVTQTIVEIDYDALYSNNLQIGYALEKYHKPKSPKPPTKRKRKKKVKSEKQSKRRGPKTPRSRGEAFAFENNGNSAMQLLEPQWIGKDLVIDHTSKNNQHIPSLAVIQSLLWTVFSLFLGKAIVSNRIESKNSEIKNIMPNRGLRSENNLRSKVEPFVELHSMSSGTPAKQKLPLGPRVGWMNLGQFCQPKTSQIEVRTL